ncbi:Sugar kinase [hydrothermal vent metagenome]|uniref:Sugar kinase n=1 Tax=hydrothermal vent metagenome TaxID=652676 RepID=A0A3B0YJ94_9ZZZZ
MFQDKFKNHILPDKVHILNVAFHVPEMRREFGGCAANIAFNLKLLGGNPLPMGTVGKDFGPYASWMDQYDIPRTHIKEIKDAYTAQAFITTDQDDNQITAFHPGAMDFAHEVNVAEAQGVKLGIVSPDGRQGMIDHASQFVEAGIPFVFDPGQAMPLFDGDDFRKFIEQATWVCVNDYESQVLQDRTGWSLQEIASHVDALVVTRGGEGSQIYTGGACIEIPTAKVTAVTDPTGCGDAYRGGLLYGLMNGLDWELTGRIAALMGAIKVEQHGTQNHAFTLDDFRTRYRDSFGSDLTVL